MLSVSIGAWADVPTGATAFGENGSYYIINSDAKTITVHIATQGDMSSYPNNPAPDLTGLTRAVITGEVHSFKTGASNGYGSDGALICSTFKNLVVDFSNATLIPIEADWTENNYSNYTGYCFGGDAKNIIVPNGANPATFQIMSLYTAGSPEGGINFYSVSGTTINAAYNSNDNKANLGDVSASATTTTLKVVKDFSASLDLSTVANTTNSAITTIDLTGITTTGTTETNAITVPATATTVICSSAGVAARITPSTNVLSTEISCAASELATKVSALTTKGYKPISITLTGTLTDAILATLGGTDMSEVTRIDLSAATVATGSDIANLTVPASLKQLVLPTAVNSASPAIPAALTLRLSGLSALDYVYIPTNDDGATTPDYVYVMKTGGLAQAFENESTLCSGKYIKVASNVALGTADVDFSALTNKPSQYIILDFSGANMSTETVQSYRTPTSSYSPTYRMILPDGWSGDDLANFAAVPVTWRGDNCAAVYSYTGTTLRILGISNSYSVTALKAPRIVRTTTTTVEFVSGTYNNTLYGRFSPNMLAAVNNAGKTSDFKNADGTAATVTGNETVGNSITTVRILTEKLWSADGNTTSYFTALTFENPTITTLNLTGIKNDSYGANKAVINLNGCTSLQGLNLDGVHAASVTANVSTLQTIGMSNVAIEGDVSFQGAIQTAFVASGRIAGNIDLTNNNKLGSIDIVNVEFKDASSVSTLQGSSSDTSLTTGDLIITRNNVTDGTNGVYTGVTEGYTKITDNIKTSVTFGTGLINTTTNGRIYPQISAVATPPYSADAAGYKKDGCAITLTLDGTTTNYTSLLDALTFIANGETLEPCNLTINTTSGYTLTSADITTINGVSFSAVEEAGDNANMYRDATLNLHGATLASGVSGAITNTSVHNIIMPKGLDKDVIKESNFSGCTNLNGVISLNDQRTALVAYVNKPGTLRKVLQQVAAFRPNVYNYMQNVNLPSVTLSGKLLASDIATNYDHLEGKDGEIGNFAETPEESASSQYIAAFENLATLRNLDISNAVFVDAADHNKAKCDNMTLSTLGWSGIVSLKMPTDDSMNEVPKNFLRNCQQIPYLCIPYNYEYIGDEAFYLAGTYWITTTDKNGAEIDNGIDTYTFSKNLKQIGSTDGETTPGTTNGWPNTPTNPVFGAVTSGRVHDVYVLANEAPLCYRGAFASGMTYGWGGFDGGNIYCREKYMNGSTLYTVLHFPQGLTDEQTKKYTDITKVYTKKDQTGAVDADGDVPTWPTFSELGRSYNQAIRGLVWDDWNENEDHLTKGDVNGGAINFDPSAYPAETTLKDETKPTDISSKEGLTRFDLSYVGWHEFVLSKATYVAPDETVVNEKIVRNYELDNNWYTFCIPFNMTEEEVIQLLGVPASTDDATARIQYENQLDGVKQTEALMPEIRTISRVVRNSNDNSVNISTSESLSSVIKTGTSKSHPKTYYMPSGTYQPNTEAGYGSDVYLRAGYPYLIKPYKIKGSTIAGNNLGKQVVTRYTFTLASSAVNYEATKEDITAITSFARPYEGHKIQAIDQTGAALTHEGSTKPYNYTFVGQFWKQELPLYCFYQSNHKWYHYTTEQPDWYWNPYICIIAVTNESDNAEAKGEGYRNETETIYPDKKGEDEKGGEVFDKNLQIVYSDGLSDDFSNNAREYHFVFDGDIMEVGEGSEATAIEVLDGVRLTPVSGKVYNMAGQHVGNTLNGLPKGMYIVNGKKYVIK